MMQGDKLKFVGHLRLPMAVQFGSAAVRRILIGIWALLVGAALYLHFFKPGFVKGQLEGVFAVSIFVGYTAFLIMGCLRGFTLIPASSLIFVGIPFFSPIPLFLLTLVGILVSSSLIYLFAERLQIYEFFARKHQAKVARLRALIEKNELPIVIGWSFFPLAPTDLICYVCGTMKVNFKKCIFGVMVGEGLICAIYIFLGDSVLRLIHLKS